MRKITRTEIAYFDYYVAYLDVLGFKELVFSKKPDDKRKIEEYFGLIEEVTNELKQIKAKKSLGTIIISDSVILSVPIEEYPGNPFEEMPKLRHLCVAVGKIQSTLALRNIWLRGAISSGKAYFDPEKSNVVGPAYINAFLLAERQAIFPRVILDHKIVNELRKQSSQDLIDEINRHQFTNWPYDILFNWGAKRHLGKGLEQDVALFIDYLSPSIHQAGEIGKLISNIEKNIYSDNHIYSKFRWVVDYLSINCQWERHLNPDGPDAHRLDDALNKLKRY